MRRRTPPTTARTDGPRSFGRTGRTPPYGGTGSDTHAEAVADGTAVADGMAVLRDARDAPLFPVLRERPGGTTPSSPRRGTARRRPVRMTTGSGPCAGNVRVCPPLLVSLEVSA